MHSGPALLRRMGEVGAVFDPRDWQTHILPAAALAVAELLRERLALGPLSQADIADLLRDEFELDASAPDVARLLDSLIEIGIVGA